MAMELQGHGATREAVEIHGTRPVRQPARLPPPPGNLRWRGSLRPAVKKSGAGDNRYPVARVPKLCLAENVRPSAGVCAAVSRAVLPWFVLAYWHYRRRSAR